MMPPDEVMAMDEDAALFFARGRPPARAAKIRHFNQPLFKRRTKIPPPPQSDRILKSSDRQQAPVPPGPEIQQPPYSPETPQPGPTIIAASTNGHGPEEQPTEQRVRVLRTHI